MEDTRQQRRVFFQFLFGDLQGYLNIAHATPTDGNFGQEFFLYPNNLEAALDYIEDHVATKNMWFCAQLLKDRRRRKSSVISCSSIWADLDACPPEKLQTKPSIVVESSPKRYQAYWSLVESVDAVLAEDAARRIAYQYAPYGADTSGWDLTQLLRIPATFNFKYQNSPPVVITSADDIGYPLEHFTETYPQVAEYSYLDEPMPVDIPGPVHKLLEKVDSPWAHALFSEKPEGDWSKKLWELERLLLEDDLTAEEVFAICWESACNKYKRDGRPQIALWKEVLKAKASGVMLTADDVYTHPLSKDFQLLTDAERILVEKEGNLVEEYTAWAQTMTDAYPDYHRIGAFMILSSLLADSIRIDTDFKKLRPNLWGMVVADSTFTRKSTSMELAMDFIYDCDSEVLISTDGSTEGIMTRVHEREGLSSLFYRDEFTGLLRSISNKSYQAGLLEALALMYDGSKQKRTLRKEVMYLRDPILLLYCGSVKTGLMDLVGEDHITSGFVPRFIFVIGEKDPGRFRRIQSSTAAKEKKRTALYDKFYDLHQWYKYAKTSFQLNQQEKIDRKLFTARMDFEASDIFEKYNLKMLMAAENTPHKQLYEPVMGRLAMSGLKMAALLAATRMEEELVITARDIKSAFFYIERWIPHSVEVVESSGAGWAEKQIRKVRDHLEEKGTVSISEISSIFQLNKKQTKDVLETMALRGWARSTGSGPNSKVSFVVGAK